MIYLVTQTISLRYQKNDTNTIYRPTSDTIHFGIQTLPLRYQQNDTDTHDTLRHENCIVTIHQCLLGSSDFLCFNTNILVSYLVLF